jgi:replicative DNA helicase Mcm
MSNDDYSDNNFDGSVYGNPNTRPTEEEKEFAKNTFGVDIGFESNGDDNNNNNNNSSNSKDSKSEPKTKVIIMSVSEASRLHRGNVSVYGMISTASKLNKYPTNITYRCLHCNTKNERSGDKFAGRKPALYRKISKPAKCINCSERDFNEEYDYINGVVSELRDVDTFSDIDGLRVVAFDELTKDIYKHLGERVTIAGEIHVIDDPSIKSKFAGYLYAQDIKYESIKEAKVTKSDEIGIQSFVNLINDSTNVNGNGKNSTRLNPRFAGKTVLEVLSEMFAQNVIGHNFPKMGIILTAASTGPDTRDKKISTAFIGPPGLAKSLLLSKSIKLVPNSRYESGQSSSGKSLTAIVSKEDRDQNLVLRIGPVPAAKGAICAINEVGRMDPEDQKYLLDIMQEQKFSINKHGINATVYSPTAIIMSGNPINNDWNDINKIDLDEIPALKPLIDRIDLPFAFRKVTDENAIREYADKKFDLQDKLIPDYSIYLQKHLTLSKKIKPILNEECKFMVKEYYINIARRGFGSPRVEGTVVAITKMIARLKLKSIADAEDAREMMQFYNLILKEFSAVVTVQSDPRDIAYNECVDVLRGTKFAITFEEVLKSACARNEHVRLYVGNRPKMRDNNKLRPLLEMLLNHSCIKRIQDKPVVLKWFENDGNGHDNGDKDNNKDNSSHSNGCDACDVCVSHSHLQKHNFAQGSNIIQHNDIIEEIDRTLENNLSGQSSAATHASHTSHPSNYLLEEAYNTISQSEFASLIGVKQEGSNFLPMYYCKLYHRPEDSRVGTKKIKTDTIYFDMIEHHFMNVEPERHKAEAQAQAQVLKKLNKEEEGGLKQ